MAQSEEHETSGPKDPGSSLCHSPLFGQNLGTYPTCEQIGKKSKKPVVENTCVSINNTCPSLFRKHFIAVGKRTNKFLSVLMADSK